MCLFHRWILDDIVYEEFTPPSTNYGIRTIEIYKRDKCSKLKYKIINVEKNTFFNHHKYFIDSLEKHGVRNIIEYKLDMIKNTNEKG